MNKTFEIKETIVFDQRDSSSIIICTLSGYVSLTSWKRVTLLLFYPWMIGNSEITRTDSCKNQIKVIKNKILNIVNFQDVAEVNFCLFFLYFKSLPKLKLISKAQFLIIKVGRNIRVVIWRSKINAEVFYFI